MIAKPDGDCFSAHARTLWRPIRGREYAVNGLHLIWRVRTSRSVNRLTPDGVREPVNQLLDRTNDLVQATPTNAWLCLDIMTGRDYVPEVPGPSR
jgi:hypothetical protein